MKTKIAAILITCSLLAGCSTFTDKRKPESLLNKGQINKALSSAKPPQQYGFSVFPTGNGISMRGSSRLHPGHTASTTFASSASPVIKMIGSAANMKVTALIDPSSADSWFEYSKAMEVRASFLGLDGKTIAYKGYSYIGQAEAYAAVIPQLRINQLFIEYAPVYVRMARNSLGPLSRNIQDANIQAVIGYDMLSVFEYIQIDLTQGTIDFSATTPYTPVEHQLVGQASISSQPGVGLAVNGSHDGDPTPVILDFAGNYEFAARGASMGSTSMIALGEVVYVNTPTVPSASVDGLPRAGRKMLQRYIVTICPRTGAVYFERPGR
jgi:hypothetical protein